MTLNSGDDVDECFEATWEVDDGYAGGARPQKTQIDPGCVTDDMEESELREMFGELIQESFDNKCGPRWKTAEEDRFIKWAQSLQKKLAAE